MQKDGAGFAGFSTYLDMSPADPDMASIPDPKSLIQLPWQPEVAWLAGDLWMNDKPVNSSPRVMLKKQIKKLAVTSLIKRKIKIGEIEKLGIKNYSKRDLEQLIQNTSRRIGLDKNIVFPFLFIAFTSQF